MDGSEVADSSHEDVTGDLKSLKVTSTSSGFTQTNNLLLEY